MRNKIQNKLLAAVILAAIVLPTAVCSAEEYVLLAKPSPAEAGVVTQTPSDGGLVTLSASAQNGYQFVYWLGDVADPTAPTTSVSTDSPKLVIAVYERTDFDNQIPLGGGGGIMTTASNANNGLPGPGPSVITGGSVSAPGGRPNRSNFSFPNIPDDPTDDDMNPDVPVPDEPIPEPSTIILFSLAGLKLIRTRKNK